MPDSTRRRASATGRVVAVWQIATGRPASASAACASAVLAADFSAVVSQSGMPVTDFVVDALLVVVEQQLKVAHAVALGEEPARLKGRGIDRHDPARMRHAAVFLVGRHARELEERDARRVCGAREVALGAEGLEGARHKQGRSAGLRPW